MANWDKLCPVADIPAGERKSFPVGALEVLVLNTGKRYYACSNECPVHSESLESGELHGHVIQCPAGDCKLDLSNGKCLTEAEQDIPIFPIEIREGWIWVKY